LRRLSVFHGGFSLPAAAAVCADLGSRLDTLDRVASLVDCSVLSIERREDGDRYRMLESIGLFSAQRLRDHREHDQARDRHARFYVELARGAPQRPEWAGREPCQGTRLNAEQDNMTAALGWCLDSAGDPDVGAELAAHLGFHLTCRGRLNTARHWLGRALERGDQVAPPAQADVHLAYAVLTYSIGEIDSSALHATRAAGIARQCDDAELLAEALAQLALAHQAAGRRREATAAAADLRSLQARVSTSRARVWALLGTAHVALAAGHPDLAAADTRAAQEIARQAGDYTRAAMCGYWLGYALALEGALPAARAAIGEASYDAVRSGYDLIVADNLVAETSMAFAADDLETARQLLPRAVKMLIEQERWGDVGRRLHIAAEVELKLGRPERSAQLLGAALCLADQLDFQDELLLPELADPRSKLGERLTTEALAEAFELGAQMSLEGVASFLSATEQAV
jgi:hypothetical protein